MSSKIKKTKKIKNKLSSIKKGQNDDDFFDDCVVCQAMKFAQKQGRMPTLSELREAFKKAGKKGAITNCE